MTQLLWLVGAILPCIAAAPWIALSGVAGDEKREPSFGSRCLRSGLSLGLGWSAASCLFYLWYRSGGSASRAYCIFEAVTCVAVAVAGRMLLRRRSPALEAAPVAWTENAETLPRGERRAFTAAAVAVVGLALAVGVTASIGEPQGYGDSWNIWNLRAKFLFAGGIERPDPFARFAFHNGYPLLLPATNARLWAWLGDDAWWSPAAVQFAFGAATAAVLGGALARLMGRVAAVFAVVVLCGCGKQIHAVCSQYAETPLQFYIAAATIVLTRRGPASAPAFAALVVGGVLTASAAWTKNEGLLFLLVAALVVGGSTAISTRRLKPTCVALGALAIGVAPVACVLWAFKSSIPEANDLIGGQGYAVTTERFCDLSRWLTVQASWVRYIAKDFKGWCVVLPAVGLLLGRGKSLPHRAGITTEALALIAFYQAGLMTTLVLTPRDLQWHLDTAADRLIMQSFPVAVWALFVHCQTSWESPSSKPGTPRHSAGPHFLRRAKSPILAGEEP